LAIVVSRDGSNKISDDDVTMLSRVTHYQGLKMVCMTSLVIGVIQALTIVLKFSREMRLASLERTLRIMLFSAQSVFPKKYEINAFSIFFYFWTRKADPKKPL